MPAQIILHTFQIFRVVSLRVRRLRKSSVKFEKPSNFTLRVCAKTAPQFLLQQALSVMLMLRPNMALERMRRYAS